MVKAVNLYPFLVDSRRGPRRFSIPFSDKGKKVPQLWHMRSKADLRNGYLGVLVNVFHGIVPHQH